MDTKIRITEADLAQFTGTEQWYRHALNRAVLYTDGAKYVADNCGAYWLLDEIALTNRFNPRLRGEEFQTWTLTKIDRTAKLVCEDGNGHKLFAKNIAFTDFPLDKIELWVEGPAEQRVILLPSEH